MTIKKSVYIATSMDGYIARSNGDLDWLIPRQPVGNDGDYGYQAFIDTVDVIVMGRNTYEQGLAFEQWPYTGKRVVVLSSTLSEIPAQLQPEVELHNREPAELVGILAERGAQHLYIDGGKTIQRFLQADLIDELIITRVPVLIGEGAPLFGPLQQDIELQHISTRAFENGMVQSRYAVEHRAAE